MKQCLNAVILTALFLSCPFGIAEFTAGFKLARLQRVQDGDSTLKTHSLLSNEQFAEMVKQPFHFLGKGAQCYAFVSADNQYVIKFFRSSTTKHLFIFSLHKLMRNFSVSNALHELCTLFAYKKNQKKRRGRLQKLVTACKLAAELAPIETGLLYLHLNAGDCTLPHLSVTSPIGLPIQIPLDNYCFIVQHKALLPRAALQTAKKEGHLSQYINALVTLIENRVHKGIFNTDSSLWRNFGFIGENAIELDFGNYIFRPDLVTAEKQREEISRYTSSLKRWLEKKAPEQLPYLAERTGL